MAEQKRHYTMQHGIWNSLPTESEQWKNDDAAVEIKSKFTTGRLMVPQIAGDAQYVVELHLFSSMNGFKHLDGE